MSQSARWQAWFDGAALPNPGKVGVGIVLCSPDGVRHEKSCPGGFSGCNNEAELHALCEALEMAYTAGARSLELHSDSDVAVRYVNGTGRTEIARLLPLIARAQAWMVRFDDVDLRWVPRHRNRDADALSRRALGLPPKPVK